SLGTPRHVRRGQLTTLDGSGSSWQFVSDGWHTGSGGGEVANHFDPDRRAGKEFGHPRCPRDSIAEHQLAIGGPVDERRRHPLRGIAGPADLIGLGGLLGRCLRGRPSTLLWWRGGAA